MSVGLFFVVYGVACLWVAGFTAASVRYRRHAGKPIFPRAPERAEFAEKWCSGRSLRNPLTAILGVARNCLMVYVSDGRLTVSPVFPFNLMFLPEIYGLEVMAPVSDVAHVEVRRRVRGAVVSLRFGESGPPPIELSVRRPEALLAALQRPGS